MAVATRATDVQMARLTGNITAQEAAWLRHAAATERAAQKTRELHLAISGVVAMAGVAATAYGLNAAAQFQRAMVGVNIATMQMDPAGMRNLVLDISGRTAQDPITIANELRTVAQSGINDPNRLRSVFPRFAEAADVLQLSKGIDPVDTVRKLTQFSHIFGVYQGKQFNDMVESAMRMQWVQPEGLDKMLTQGRQFVGQAMARGVPLDEIFRIYAEMGQTGFLAGRGGSGVKQVLNYMGGAESLTNHMSQVRRSAFLDMSRMGEHAGLGRMFDSHGRLRFYDEQGNLHLETALKYLADLNAYMGVHGGKAQFANDITNAFGEAGANWLLPVLRPEAQKQFGAIDQNWAKIPNIQAQFTAYIDTFLGSLQQMTTNFKRIVIDIFTPLMPEFTRTFQAISNVFVGFAQYLEAHHDAARNIGNLIIVTTGIFTVLTGVLALQMFTAGPMIAASSAEIATALTGLAATMNVEGVAVAGGALRAGGGLATLATGLTRLAGPLGVVLALIGLVWKFKQMHDAGQLGPDAALPQDKGLEALLLRLGINPHAKWDGHRWVDNPDAISSMTDYMKTPETKSREARQKAYGEHLGRMFDRAVHIQNLEVHVDHPGDVGHLLNDPLHAMNINAPDTRTHQRIPMVISVLGASNH